MMDQNLEKRLLELARAYHRISLAMVGVKTRFAELFDALAADIGISRNELGERFGWIPIPQEGNKIMRGEVEPSNEDVMRLLGIYIGTRK